MSKSRSVVGVTLLGGLLAAGLLSASACGAVANETAIQFVGQCSPAGTINLSIDGGAVGSIGGTSTSQAFPVSSGSHSLSARGGTYIWPARSVTVPDGETFRMTLTC